MDKLKAKLIEAGLNIESFGSVSSPADSQFYSIYVDGKDALIRWQDARKALSDVGWYPLLVDDKHELERLSDDWPDSQTEGPLAVDSEDLDFNSDGRQRLLTISMSALQGVDQSKVQAAVMSERFCDSASVLRMFERVNPDLSVELKQAIEAELRLVSHENLDVMMGWIAGARGGLLEQSTNLIFEEALHKIECPHFTPSSIAQIIDVGEQLDLLNWLKVREEAYATYYSYSEGTWSVTDSQESLLLQSFDGLSRKKRILMILVPAKYPWHVPAHMYFGDCSECPVPQVHVAIFKYWYERYGAEIIVMTHSTVELIVRRPISDKNIARNVALQQYIYNPELVHQDDGKLLSLASKLLNAPSWLFCWD